MGSPTPLKKNSPRWQASEAGLHGGGQLYPPCAVFTVAQGERAMKAQDQPCGPPTVYGQKEAPRVQCGKQCSPWPQQKQN